MINIGGTLSHATNQYQFSAMSENHLEGRFSQTQRECQMTAALTNIFFKTVLY
jgi:hypothetical protein